MRDQTGERERNHGRVRECSAENSCRPDDDLARERVPALVKTAEADRRVRDAGRHSPPHDDRHAGGDRQRRGLVTSKEREGSRGPAAAQDAGNGASGDGRVGGKDVVRGRGSVGDNDRSRSASGRPRSTGGGGSPSREPAAKRSRASSPPEAASGGRFTTRPWAADIPRRGGSGGTAASFDKGRQGKRGRDREQCALGGGPRRGSPSRGRSQEQQLERSGSRGRGADGEVAVPRESGQPGERLRPGREGAATRTCLARPLSPLPPPRPTPPLRLQSLHVCAVPAGSVADRDYGAHRRQPPPCRAPPPPRPLQSVLSLGGGATPFKPSRLSLPWPIWPTLGGGGAPAPGGRCRRRRHVVVIGVLRARCRCRRRCAPRQRW